ncbi:MAG: helix-turn-helix transcriptional regulator [Clostridia bacterium]|nr:helix-turn-helix transcriptional regulator [Clostridia bacterium]
MTDDKSQWMDSIKQIRALNDPYRQEIISRIALIGRPANSKEIAVSMNEPPSKVNYHLKVLEKYGYVKVEHTENVNGIIAKYYDVAEKTIELKRSKSDKTAKNDETLIKTLDGIFTTAKEKYLSAVVKSMGSEVDGNGRIQSILLYLDDNDIEEISTLFEKLSENKKEGKELYSVFMSYIKER